MNIFVILQTKFGNLRHYSANARNQSNTIRNVFLISAQRTIIFSRPWWIQRLVELALQT